MDELASVRVRVRVQHERNAQLQRDTEEHARLLKKLAELELQNRLFEDRFEEDDAMIQATVGRLSQAGLELQERCRMGNEDIAENLRIIHSIKLDASERLVNVHDRAAAARRLHALKVRLDALEARKLEAAEMAKDNISLFDQIQDLRRSGVKPRWQR